MDFSSELITPEMPPPQAVLNQRPLWWTLILLLFTTFMLRMTNYDVVGGILCLLLLFVAYVIVYDGMHNAGKFSLLLGMLCGLNFLFYFVPFISNVIAGRSESHLTPVESTNHNGEHELTYVITVKTYAFFDLSRGLLYNLQSLGMMVMPFCMLFGFYLGLSAHVETRRSTLSIFEHDDDSEYGFTETDADQLNASLREDASLGAVAQRQLIAAGYGAISNGAQSGNHKPMSFFTGKAHKLIDA